MPDINLKGKEFRVPTKCVEKIKLALSKFTGPKTTEGYERAINIVKEPNISLELLKKINNFFRNVEEGSWPYKLTGGDYGKKIFSKMEEQTRSGEASSKKNKMRGGLANTHYKEHEKTGSNPTKVNVPNPNVDLTEQIDKINHIINYL